MSDENDVNHFSEADTTGRVFNLSLTPSDDSRTKKLYASSTKIIPVVYIHGMLSAALKAKGQEGKKRRAKCLDSSFWDRGAWNFIGFDGNFLL